MIKKNTVKKHTIRSDWELDLFFTEIKLLNTNVNFGFNVELKHINSLSMVKPYGTYDLSKIPETIIELDFRYEFSNCPKEIPVFIKKLVFYKFHFPLENIPTNVNCVTIENGFNLSVDNLGNNFIELDFGNSFNQPIDNLPSSLEKITLGTYFTHSINNLPDNIKFIHLHNPKYDHTKIHKLPKSILFLQFGTENVDIELNLDNLTTERKKYYFTKENNSGISSGKAFKCDYFNNFYFF